ncbi:ZYRO0B06512p [Zygosaccharomyces rouxii]|uniref:non-specific serine/threonine protein kinase n=1 Tax=Zygosaccharomyces rouxii (strain ATCC 2623 / CBS 732 / NBRC 1130 / NCYC 568 / NRRL Y-229) TaxID=559307 RepID=C5DR91_ZYGRC|nr:uncharacterized protein ZYRO0B06512g [Zygosaccharomyces rouxii]KAH9200153.1 hypothetical protein LQ764DRAFT_113362 [Zygosaccharomyces rouxii]CAR26302.1 ZYRO0B06512p [Zygosaccharomyces rouxii]
MTINGIGRPDTRPLLPGDEDEINSQFTKRHAALQIAEMNRRRVRPPGGPLRSVSSRNLGEPLENDSLPLHRALTNTDNFIPNADLESESIITNNGSGDLGYSADEQESLGSEDNLSHLAEMEHGMQLDPRLKKQREEWAEKGAAKIVRDVTNPKTGQTTKEVIKKGIKDFKFGDTLGDGSYSTVMVATARDSGKKYAVKVLSKEYLIRQKKVKYVNIEKNALQRLNNSRGIIRLYFTFQDEASLYFLLEYAPNGDFLSIMKKYGSLNEECTCYYSAQIIDAIKFLHQRGIIHRDIKPENILLDKEMKVKLTDFGTAKLLDGKSQASGETYDLHTRSKSFVGTAEYVSPELLNDNWVDYRCDIWAFGCIVFQMIAGKPPFKATNEYLTFQKVMKVQYAFTAGFPVVVRDLVKRILLRQPDQRLSIPQIERHYFYRDKNFRDGSIWFEPAPEVQPYRVTAKSMQPIPALNTNQHQYQYQPKRPMYVKPTSSGKLTAQDSAGGNAAGAIGGSGVGVGGGGAAAIAASSNNPSSNNGVSSPVGPAKAASPAVPQKKVMDDTTAQILDRARREVDNRKFPGQKRSTAGTATQNAAYKKNQSSMTSSPSSSGASSIAPLASHVRPKSAATVKSTNTYTSPMIFPSNNGSTNTVDSMKKTSASPPISQGFTGQPPGNRVVGNETKGTLKMSKIDLLWELYLKDSNEHVLGAGEVNFAVVDNSSFERRVSKSNGSLSESQRLGSSRATLLSQVARGGGGVTGLRNEYNPTTLLESDYYGTLDVSLEDLHPDYQVLGGDSSLNPSAEKEGSPTPSSEENPNAPISNKFRKFFYHKQDATPSVTDLGNYYRRMLVVTSYGRVLILTKRNKLIPGTSMNFDLCYDINVSQSGVRIREVSVPSVTEKSGNFVIQTPYDSFLFRTTEHSVDGWLLVLHDCIKRNHERLVTKSKNDAARNEDAMKAAKLATPVLVQEKPVQQREPHQKELYYSSSPQALGSPPAVPSRTPKTPRSSLYSVASGDSTVSLSGTGPSRSAKNEHMFESFVNSKEKNTKKQTSPVPMSSKLVSGLPYYNYNNSVGLGISPQSSVSPAVANTGKTSKKSINPSNSRLLARSEQTFRRKH